MPLMIVESGAKIKTLARLLDGEWSFVASQGHLFDLPESRMGIDDEYDPEWVAVQGAPLDRIRGAARDVSEVYVASDPDREGEAIAWQIDELVLEDRATRRLRLESITEEEVRGSLEDAGEIDRRSVEAQWARRLLDRLAGYKVSPFLVNAFKGKRLSAGRVQSAVLALVVERHRAVRDFEPETFYHLDVHVQTDEDELTRPLEARLVRIGKQAVGTGENQRLLTDQKEVENLAEAVREHGLTRTGTERDTTETGPAFPFDSSELLRRASQWFGWSTSRTMNVAQSLYEKGLITYHRSDSTRLSRDACRAAAAFVREEYGDEYHQWRGGGGGDQEGHEAIRAKSPFLTPDQLHSVSRNERTLYAAIWQRYVQSQMTAAVWDRLRVHLVLDDEGPQVVFEGQLRSLREPGFLRCRRPEQSRTVSGDAPAEDLDRLQDAGSVGVEEVAVQESETEGPTPFTEGSLVGTMKREGIGRPSTYSSTIQRLRRRQYITIEDGLVEPTSRGEDVCRFLKRAVPAICDVGFTRRMEKTLDEIARGEASWRSFVRSFDRDLEGWLEEAEGIKPEGTAESWKEPLDYAECPRCGGTLIQRKGRRGKFVHCESEDCDFTSDPPAKTYRCPQCERHMAKRNGRGSALYYCLAYPDCEGRRPVGEPRVDYEEMLEEAPDCPDCESRMELRRGRYGSFWGCPNYPDCEGTRPWNS